jgi:DNA-binding protein YbaB
MQTQTIEGIKSQLELFRSNLIEEFEDTNQRVKLKINGHFKIIELKVPDDLHSEEIEQIVPELFTKAIESIGNKIRQKLEEMQTVPN